MAFERVEQFNRGPDRPLFVHSLLRVRALGESERRPRI